MISKINDTLQELGIMQQYRGYRYMVMALELIIEDEFNLCHISGNIYGSIAGRYGCSVCSIERNIRTIRGCIWDKNRDKLREIARYELRSEPSVTEFLCILYNHIIRNDDEV